MNFILRFVFFLAGIAGLAFLVYRVIDTFPNVNPVDVLVITIPDMLLFFLAYKTYPADEGVKKYR
jgi:hypothetical protein